MKPTTDLETLRRRLTEWLLPQLVLGELVPEGLRVSLDVPIHGGMSNDTLLVSAGWEEHGEPSGLALVVKMEPAGPALFPSYDLGREAAVLRAVAEHSDVPVPEVFAVELDPAPLGRPFFMMREASGRVPADDPPYFLSGWLHDASPEEQRTALDSALDTMAAIHDLPPREILAPGEPFRTPGADGLDADLSYWHRYLDWLARDAPVPMLPGVLDWCVENRPAPGGPDVLCWGDARMGNLMFGDDFHVSAVLDWEMAGPGPRETDLGWFLFAHDTALMWMDDLPGFRDRDGMVERYTRASGREPADLLWHEVWAGVRAAAVHLRSLRISGGDTGGETPLMLSLRRLVDLP